MGYDANIVKKPWGYEYLVYENDKVGLWLLYIAKDQQTSMHCHPNKTTGLAVLNGNVTVSFLNNQFDLSPEETEILNEQFPKILEYFDLLSKIDTSKIEHVESISNVFREDIARDSIADEILDIIPSKKERFVKGPRMV